MIVLVCSECGRRFEEDELPKRGSVCFKCHVKTIRLGFTYGQEAFHGPTVREQQAKIVSDAKINGYDAQPVGERWV
ncbi:MAG: DNA-directed RNA polymerase [Podoviridae sp. ctDWo9]|nr:MAG: DNA-directed RNA polymerase [Podoviridae sp. ctDWo9]